MRLTYIFIENPIHALIYWFSSFLSFSNFSACSVGEDHEAYGRFKARPLTFELHKGKVVVSIIYISDRCVHGSY